jgi:hypothetical protein
MDFLRLVALLLSGTLLSGCASVVSGTYKNVRVTSDPPGALVRLDGTTRGVTPTVLHPSPRSDHRVTIELPGYKPFELVLQRRHDAMLVGNVATGVFPGMGLDAATGAIYTLRPNPVHVDLVPLGDASRSSGK